MPTLLQPCDRGHELRGPRVRAQARLRAATCAVREPAHARPERSAWAATLATLLTLVALPACADQLASPDSLAAIASDSTSLASAAPETLAAFPAPRVRAWQVGLVRPDRLEHAGLSFSLGVALTIAFHDRLPAGAVTLALGAGKEYWDSRHSHAEAMDLVADAVGLGLALVLVRGRAP